MQPFKWNKNGYPYFGTPVMSGSQICLPSGEYKLEKRLVK